jgi:hypothetical protein
MVFDKESIFPYPILSKFSSDYPDGKFNLEVNIEASPTNYIFKIKYEVKSDFLNDLILKGKAKIYFLIESKDSKFFEPIDDMVSIPKNRISLNKKTNIQLIIMANENISFDLNSDLDAFYEKDKSNIKIEKYNILALSNVERFNGDLKKPYQLFQKRVDATIKSDIKIEFNQEFIVIVFKNKDYHFSKKSLNNHYIYIGLQKALIRFIVELSLNNRHELFIEEMSEPENPLFFKLYNLLKMKRVNFISIENIDEVIYKISDKIIEKHYLAIEDAVRL